MEDLDLESSRILSELNFSLPSIKLFYHHINSPILVSTGEHDTTVHLTQYVWIAVAPPVFVANNN